MSNENNKKKDYFEFWPLFEVYTISFCFFLFYSFTRLLSASVQTIAGLNSSGVKSHTHTRSAPQNLLKLYSIQYFTRESCPPFTVKNTSHLCVAHHVHITKSWLLNVTHLAVYLVMMPC